MAGHVRSLYRHNGAGARRASRQLPEQLQVARKFQDGAWQHHMLKDGAKGRRWLAHPQGGTAIFPCVCISAGLHGNTSSSYLVWPTTSRIDHGSAEERATYFGGMAEHGEAATQPAPSAGVEHDSCAMPAESPVAMRRQATTLLDLMTIRAFHSRALRRHSLGTALGFRIRGGVLTHTPAIIVFVARKVHMQWLMDDQKLPSAIEGPDGVWCEVDVLEFSHYGAPTSASREPVQNELVDRLRGADACVGSGSQVASHETYGTLGAIVRSQAGTKQLGFLTNRHVAVDLDFPNQKMFHPLPPKLGPGILLGAVERAASFVTDDLWYGIFAGVNPGASGPESFVRADGAFVPFADGLDFKLVTTTVRGIGDLGDVMHIDLQGPVNSVVGRKVVKVGRSSGLTHGCVMAHSVEYNDENGICFFTDFLIVGDNGQGFDLEGDSGSLILLAPATADEKPIPLGIIWGGTANRGRLKLRHGHGPENWTSGVDLGRLLNLLQLDLVTTDEEMFIDLEPLDEQSGDGESKQPSTRLGRLEAGLLTFRPLESDPECGQSVDLEDSTDMNSTHPLAVEGRRFSDQDAAPDDVRQLAFASGLVEPEQTGARNDSRRNIQGDASLGLGLFDGAAREAKRRRSR